jgi:hypothetical protein
MRDDLMAVEVEIHPFGCAAPLGAADQPDIKAPRGVEVIDRKREVKGRQGHEGALVIPGEAKQSREMTMDAPSA